MASDQDYALYLPATSQYPRTRMNLKLQIEADEKRIAKKKALAKLDEELNALCQKNGFKSLAVYQAALDALSGEKPTHKSKAVAKKGKRGKVDAAAQTKLKKMFKDGAKNREVAKALGVSMITVATWKKKLGLLKKK